MNDQSRGECLAAPANDRIPVYLMFVINPDLIASADTTLTETSYQLLDEILRRAGAESDAAECHGTLVGLACSNPGAGPEPWLDLVLVELDPDDLLVAECRAALLQLYQSCCSDLQSQRMVFDPLLPEDDQHISVRASAMGRWCQGFLFGLSLGGLPEFSSLPGEVPDIITDMSELTRAGVDEGTDEEEGEQAYAELIEFIRVSVRLVHEELNPLPECHDPTPTLH